MSPALPSRARVVVIGGGVIGTSIAYHLAHAGERDVLLLERDRLTSGTTWHAAGLMTCFGSFSETSTRMRLYSRDLYARLEMETGLSTGFRPVGLVEAAADAGRLEEYRRVATFQRHLGLEVEEVSPAEMHALFPHARVDDLAGGFHVPGDGRVNPVDLTMASPRARERRACGSSRASPCRTSSPADEGATERATGVRTDAGDVECEVVVNAAGMWARELGQRQGLVVPNQAAEHYYLITDTIEGLDPDGPVFEDPASHGYYREEGGGMMVGLFEPEAAAWQLDGIPRESSFRTLPPDWDRMAPFLERAMDRVPVTHEVGIRTFFCGPESFTPDLAPIVGESPAIAGYFVCAGLNSVGILSAGGLGRIMAHWVTTGVPDVDVTGFAVARTQPHQPAAPTAPRGRPRSSAPSMRPTRPARQLRSARGVRRSPLHDGSPRRGAAFTDVSGGRAPRSTRREELARRLGAAAAGGAAGRPSTAPSGRPSGCSTCRSWPSCSSRDRTPEPCSTGCPPAPWTASRGGSPTRSGSMTDGRIEADLTVTKLGEDPSSSSPRTPRTARALAWLRRHARRSRARPCSTRRAGMAQFNVQGPRSRDVLAGGDLAPTSATGRSRSATARRVDLGLARALCMRITYVGELGCELYVPTEMAAHAYETLWRPANRSACEPVGLRALSQPAAGEGLPRLRPRHRQHRLTSIEAGLGFAVALDKPGTSSAARRSRPRRPPAIRRPAARLGRTCRARCSSSTGRRCSADGAVVGYVRAGSQGWTVGGAVGLALVANAEGSPADKAWLDAGEWTVDVAGTTHPASVSLRPLHDPANERIRG